MNKIYILLLALAPTMSFASVCDNKDNVSYYFANGMLTDLGDGKSRRGAKYSARSLHYILHQASIPVDSIKTSYNANEDAGIQFLEAARQRINSDFTQFWRWISGLDVSPDWVVDTAKVEAEAINYAELVDDEDLQSHVLSYVRDIESGKRVMVIAHSQGNLYANRAYDVLKNTYGMKGDYYGVVSVATPDNHTVNGAPYTTLWNDAIINIANNFLPATLDPYYVNPFSSYGGNDLLSHGFLESYLRMTPTGMDASVPEHSGTKILADIQTVADSLSQPLPEFARLAYSPVVAAAGLSSLGRTVSEAYATLTPSFGALRVDDGVTYRRVSYGGTAARCGEQGEGVLSASWADLPLGADHSYLRDGVSFTSPACIFDNGLTVEELTAFGFGMAPQGDTADFEHLTVESHPSHVRLNAHVATEGSALTLISRLSDSQFGLTSYDYRLTAVKLSDGGQSISGHFHPYGVYAPPITAVSPSLLLVTAMIDRPLDFSPSGALRSGRLVTTSLPTRNDGALSGEHIATLSVAADQGCVALESVYADAASGEVLARSTFQADAERLKLRDFVDGGAGNFANPYGVF